jgi:P-type Ca2+ transporter type 2C
METKWHTSPLELVLSKLGTNLNGLTKEEAKQRLEEQGLNKLPEAKVDSTAIIFLRQFQSPLIYILLAAGVVVFFMGQAVDASVILFVLLFNAVVGAIQEGKAQNTLIALKQFVETKAVVLRNGEEIIIKDSEVVTGDIIMLQEGEKIPADARIINARNLKVDEAALTGESEAVHKISEELDDLEAPTLEQKNMVFKGTHVVSGNGKAVVVASGVNTLIGKIAKEIATIETDIPLKANIRNLSNMIIAATGLISLVIFSIGILRGNGVKEMLATVISISVSVIPEGLPIALTLILATGVWRMSKRNALVKRLQAVEALGQAQVIAVDKTGTLTRNEMVIQNIYTDGKTFEVAGVGYEAKGNISLRGQVINPPNHPELMLAGKIAAFCANARTMLSEETGLWRVSGDPTEASMFVLAEKLGFNKDDIERESPLVRELPFDYLSKYHATVHETAEGKFMTVVGAPEVILGLSNKVWRSGEERAFVEGEETELENEYYSMSKSGLRILAYAFSRTIPNNLEPEEIHSLTFGGFFGLKDALRPEVLDATKRAQMAGIKVVMITGDHKSTAEALAREAMIFKDGDSILTGEEIDNMSEQELKKRLTTTTVFARVTPEHKLKIINAYKSRGEVVAMTGDGVNDAPSLVSADLGVAMGKVGTEVAKEASDIVLLDDNFGSIVSAIEEGRSIYKTIKKVVLYLISTSIGEVLVIGGAISIGLPLPLLPAQIIWLNFVTDGFFTVALAMEPKEKGLLNGTFGKPKKYIVDSFMGQRMLVMALPMMVGTLILFSAYQASDLTKAWTVALTALAVFQWLNAWNCRSAKESVFSTNPFSNRSLIGATACALLVQLLAVYNPLFQKFLHTVPLNLTDWFLIISFSLSVILAEEIRKIIANKQNSKSINIPTIKGVQVA